MPHVRPVASPAPRLATAAAPSAHALAPLWLPCPKRLNHFWKECVGSGHALLGTRRDWLDHLQVCPCARSRCLSLACLPRGGETHQPCAPPANPQNATRDIGFKRIRFHGILDDDMSVQIDKGQPPNFFNVFQVYDNILALGVRPIVELSFMPSKLVTCGSSGCDYAFGNPVSGYKGQWRSSSWAGRAVGRREGCRSSDCAMTAR